MRFGLVHRLLIDAMAALGALAVLASEQVDPTVRIVLGLAIVLALLVPENAHDRPWVRQLGVVAPLTALSVQVMRLLLGAPILPTAVEFATALQAIRLASRRGAAHDQQIILLSLIHLIAGSVLTEGLAYGVAFLGFLVVAPSALVLSHLRREVEGNYRQGARDRTGLPVDVPRILRSRRVVGREFLLGTSALSVPIFLFTALLFVLFPRVGLSLLLLDTGKSHTMVGFSDDVSLGKIGTLRHDATLALRVRLDPPLENPPERVAFYLRGVALDEYDGLRWHRTKTDVLRRFDPSITVRLRRGSPAPGDRRYEIQREPIEPSVLFLPSDTTAIRFDRPPGSREALPPMFSSPEDVYSFEAERNDPLRYTVWQGRHLDSAASLPADDLARYTQLPANLSTRVRQLAADWAPADATPRQLADMFQARLRDGFSYSLSSPSGGATDPLDHFLFESKAGHCEYFSTALAVLLRVRGVPTRNVTGFLGATKNPFGDYWAVRQGDAHSWVEAHLPGEGWVRLDATPPAELAAAGQVSSWLSTLRDLVEAAAQRWDRHVVGYDLHQQLDLFRRVRNETRKLPGLPALQSPRGAAIGAATLLLLGGLVWAWRRRPRSSDGTGSPAQARTRRRAVELYRSVQRALATLGLPRPADVPPLAHVTALTRAQHPLAAEARELTLEYLATRFGNEPRDDATWAALFQRARTLNDRARALRAQAQATPTVE